MNDSVANEAGAGENERSDRRGWSLVWTVFLAILVGLLAAGLAKLLLISINFTETFIHQGLLFDFDGSPLMDLAKTGDAEKKAMLAEYTLVSKNEKASGAVFDLTTS